MDAIKLMETQMFNTKFANFEDLLGQTLVRIENRFDDKLRFHTDDGQEFIQYHEQDCCETVEIEDIVGDLDDLIGTPILCAEERVSFDESGGNPFADSQTWTFYELRTIKGSVTIRWHGQSNGYYSESVSFAKVK